MIRRIALVVGDTPGHCYPALSVAEAYGRIGAPIETMFFGPGVDLAADLVHRHGYEYQPIGGSALARAGTGARLAAGARTAAGLWQARRALRRQRTKLVIAFGGYASGPLVLAARSLGLTAAIHEGNVEPGLANRWLARAADRIYLNFDATRRYFNHDRQLVVGWPIRREFSALAETARTAPGLGRASRLLVIGGHGIRASRFLNHHAPDFAGRLAQRGIGLDVRHRTDVEDAAELSARYLRAGVAATVTSTRASIVDDFAWADFVVSRAGAGIIAELAAAGLPALLVPLSDAAADHQVRNAEAFAAAGGGDWTREDNWDADALAATVAALLTDARAWSAASAAARRLAKPDAAYRVVMDCEALMAGRW